MEEKKHQLLAEMTTDLHACCVEALSDRRFLCGLYQLNEKENERRGRLLLCDIGDSFTTAGEDSESLSRKVTVIDAKDVEGGVLDCKVSGYIIAAALSTGKLDFFRVTDDLAFLQPYTYFTAPEEGLFLSVDWMYSSQRTYQPLARIKTTPSSEYNFTNAHLIAVSTQESSILVYDTSRFDMHSNVPPAESTVPEATNIQPYKQNEIDVPVVHFKNTHALAGESVPAWIVAFDPYSTGTRLLSGGDDCAVRLWDTRCADVAIAANTTSHSAGVTSAQWHPVQENFFATGSYDGILRLWDARSMRKPVWELDTGGGIWRTKWWSEVTGESKGVWQDIGTDSTNEHEKHSTTYLGLACMHAGSALYAVDEGKGLAGSTLRLIGRHYQHSETPSGHLAYGFALLQGHPGVQSEQIRESPQGPSFLAVSCSFYDNLVQVWAV